MYEKINRAVKDGSLMKNQVLIEAMKHAKRNNSVLHLMGLCSDEGVHAHTEHLIALLEMAKKEEVKEVEIHFFADGRDVAEKSAEKYAEIIEKAIKRIGVGKIVSIVGRYYSMDRDNNWDRTEEAYDMLTLGKGHKSKDIKSAIKEAYKRGDKTDYYIQSTILEGFKPVRDNDAVIFFNFRTDRPRQLTQAFIFPDFNKFKRKVFPKTYYCTMSEYDKTFTCPYAFSEDEVTLNLGRVLANSGLKQMRIAETEKYGHVTFFFNSQIEVPNKNEERILIPSAKVASYDLKPEMSAYDVADEAVKQIKSGKFDFILVNFANCDLVGHSAVKEAIVKCVEVVDDCTGKVVNVALDNDYTIIVTADHGSAEDKLYPDGKPKPAHSCNPVNFILIDKHMRDVKLGRGGQKDVAPTILDIMGLKKPKEMTGESLIQA